jgi:Ras-related GTP-binding protein A/B
MRDHIFRSVELLVYVFDVAKPLDMGRFNEVMEALAQHSREAKVFVLLHKIDLVPELERVEVFRRREGDIMECCKSYADIKVRCFPSSIWDETLYRAWSQIVYSLVPNTQVLERHLETFCGLCGGDEVVVFESTTFLVIAHWEEKRSAAHADAHRFEKISNIIVRTLMHSFHHATPDCMHSTLIG